MSAFKVTDLFLGEKNFIDFVEKNLGQEMERLLSDQLETDVVCSHIAGGILDYPLMISHDFADITCAIDIYMDAFTRDMRNQTPKPYAFGVFKKSKEKNDRLGKMPFRGDELTVKQFISAILAACPKLRSHIIDCTDEVTSTGRLENLYVIISNVVMIRNYIWVFLEVLEADNKAKLKVEYKDFCDLAEILSEQTLQIFGNLLTTFILHDEQSQCFSGHRAYYEGERGSPIIPMWAYFIKGMQRDMWSIMPPQLAQRILAIIINDSLAILGTRYSQIKPTEATTPQFIVDILNILTSIQEFLFYISPDLPSVCGQIEPATSKILFSIHMKCHCLASALITVGCPLEVLYKNFRRGLSSCNLLTTQPKSLTRLSEPPWMSMLSVLCPKFYPSEMDYPDWELWLNIKLICAQSAPNWALIYKVVTMHDCKIAAFILSMFPTVSAPVTHFLLEGHGFRRCKNASCMDPDCHGLPKTLPNYLAASCTAYIVATALPWNVLPKVYRPILSKITDWSAMDKTQIWNSKNRPVWFQSLIDILLPVLKTCVQSLILLIAETVQKPTAAVAPQTSTAKPEENVQKPGSTSNPNKLNPNIPTRRGSVSAALNVNMEKEEELLTQWVIELLNTVTEILSIIPRGFFVVCEEMDDLIPRKHIPVRNTVPVHFLVTALYMLLNLGSGIINSILEEEAPPPVPAVVASSSSKSKSKNAASKAPPSKDVKKAGRSNKKEPSPVPSVSNHLEPCLLSIAERLCYLDDSVFDQVVHRLVTQIESMMKHTKTHHDKTTINIDSPSDFAMEWDISHLKADFLMENIEGQLSLRVMYWFILTHGPMLQNVLTGDVNQDHSRAEELRLTRRRSKDGTGAVVTLSHGQAGMKTKLESMPQTAKVVSKVLKIVPRIKVGFAPVNIIHDFHYVNKYRTFDEVLWDPKSLDWVQTIRHCCMGLQKVIIGKLLEKRWEFKQSTDEGILRSTDEKTINLQKIVNELKALMLT